MPTSIDGLGVISWWHVELVANVSISVAYLCITALIVVPTVRLGQARTNKLAMATAAIFFSCSVGHGLHALHPLLAGPQMASAMSMWWSAGWHTMTAGVAVYYLTLRGSYGRLLTAAPMFSDLREQERLAELEKLQAASAARLEAEGERDANAAMLMSIIENSQSAIYVKDLDGRYLMANPLLQEIMGRPEEEILGHTDVVVDPELARVWRANDVRAEQGSYRLEEWNDAYPDGRHFYDSVKFPLYDAAGAVYATCGVSLDVTEQRRATAAIAAARDAAIAATAAKSTFLAAMSHEIRTPMNAVIGMTDLLMGTELDTQQQEFVDTVRSSGDALLVVINDILDFSKIEAGELHLENQPFALRDEVEGCLDMVIAGATAKGLDLGCDLDETCPGWVCGDVVRLRQILTNLLSNAVKFTQHGEVVMTASARPVRSEDTGVARVELMIRVRDTGIGIPAAGLERLFKSFSQVDASTTRLYGGTGLGLAISQRLAEAMGGRVEVSSDAGVGSTFTVTVVLDATAVPAREREHQRLVESVLDGKRVLVVDDNATNLRILELQLTRLGMSCHCAATPAAAIALIAAGLAYDVAVLDVLTPELDGLALGAALHELSGARAPHVLLTSVGARSPSNETSCAAVLTKPVRSSMMRDTLTTVLGSAATGSPLATGVPALPATAPQPQPQPLQVLLAEDNPVNQRVAQLMLAKLGHTVDIVGSGLEAVEGVRARSYDVVLMDVQMPHMDGLEATRRIVSEIPPDQQPVVIAMTASALAEDRDACLAAGMRGFLSKPVRAEDLRLALASVPRITAPPPPTRTSEHPDRMADRPDGPPAVEPTLPPAVDEGVLAELAEQLGDADGTVISDLLASYVDDGAAEVPLLVEAARARATARPSPERPTRCARRARCWSASAFVELLQRTEDAAHAASPELPALAQLVAAEFTRVQRHVAMRAGSTPVPAGVGAPVSRRHG